MTKDAKREVKQLERMSGITSYNKMKKQIIENTQLAAFICVMVPTIAVHSTYEWYRNKKK